MSGPLELTDFQIAVSRLFFELAESHGFAVAGGAALVASELVHRKTHDIHLFACVPLTSVEHATKALALALQRADFDVEAIHDSPTFARLVVRKGPGEVLVDLAIDSPPTYPPTVTVLGPTLAPNDLAGRKLLALFSRAEARDFADVFVLARRIGKDQLIDLASSMDAGFDKSVLAQMMASMSRFADSEIPLRLSEVAEARAFFHAWSAEILAG